MLLGAHVDDHDPITQCLQRGVSIGQISLGDPQSWKGPVFNYPGGAEALRDDATEAGITFYVHSPFVINLASTNNRIRIPSRQLLQKHLNAAASINAAGLVVHGGHVVAGDDPETGFDNWRKAIDGLDPVVPVLIENTAGGANAMARTEERLAGLWQAISTSANIDQVGFCLDTCHAHAAGLEPDGLVERIIAITGRIDLVHANDSRDGFGSGADRHANFGQGQLDLDLAAQTLTSVDAPLIIETPGPLEAHLRDLAWLRSLTAVA